MPLVYALTVGMMLVFALAGLTDRNRELGRVSKQERASQQENAGRAPLPASGKAGGQDLASASNR
jgi:hypothetical protein